MNQTRIIFFCLGNICRSPLAEGLFRYKVEQRGLAERFHIESAGTSAYHIGEAPDPGSQKVALDRLDLDISHQRAQQLEDAHHHEFDVLVAMDRSNRRHALRMDGADSDKILLLRNFEPEPQHRGTDVPDPYGGGVSQFDLVFDIVDRCTERLLDHLLSEQ
ncbi:low molecular weight phosphotyrosine protein phosphatase [Persicimonas caeni]|uniref:protein-tyrosine-phosphatase n=1 Tax=Persicimonas caeni TaxID=2292766 RepID=A0A4Y6Q142_PERCE|nr:low molecular weight protein-tyrosine-phosphatase [Persicimonas caeni]QDG54294.1 low molecular weight phosphotyrosine protein phosphatase [Persicimonas caeni]QED35515.1 low molecular weight phosphotyrosine protein phosphatase [Persicimonas caeni]